MGRTFTVAAVQAAYVLMDREATTDKVVRLIGEAGGAGRRADRVPRGVRARHADLDRLRARSGTATRHGSPGSSTRRSSCPSPTTDRIGAAAREAGAYVVMGVDEREPHGTTIYNTLLYFGPDGRLLNKHRKLMPTGSERTVWGMGDGSTLDVVPTDLGRLGGLICWENYMPLARFHLYAQGVEVWVAPTLAHGRRLDRHDAPHRPRGPGVGHRGEPVRPGRPDPGRLPRPRPGLARRSKATRPSGSSRATA